MRRKHEKYATDYRCYEFTQCNGDDAMAGAQCDDDPGHTNGRLRQAYVVLQIVPVESRENGRGDAERHCNRGRKANQQNRSASITRKCRGNFEPYREYRGKSRAQQQTNAAELQTHPECGGKGLRRGLMIAGRMPL